MISVEEALIDKVTETLHYLRTGKVPQPIAIPHDLPDNEMRQLLVYLNRLLSEFAPFAEAMEQIAQGELDTRPVLGRMGVVQSFKALQSNLRHLTWKTQQIAAGDLEQQVDFMGDFSTAFNRMTQQLKESYQELERRNRFIRKTFGRYTSDEIVEALLDMPDGLTLGGEKREVTLLMSDLRGFTALAEGLEPTEVVALLNHYLSAMVGPIQRNGGTIDEIIGDAIFVLFGAPLAMEDAGRRAIQCALEMQKAMDGVNDYSLQKGWPEIEMGIALHTGEVVVGNIGSEKRSKYGVVGRNVNLTARIESFSVGGQVLVSPTTIHAAGDGLILGEEVEINAKGMREPLKCHALLGHRDHPDLTLEREEATLKALSPSLPIQYGTLTGKHIDAQMRPATLIALSQKRAVMESDSLLQAYDNIILRLDAETGDEVSGEIYAKVIRSPYESVNHHLIHFTSMPSAARNRLDQLAGEKG